jgi:adenylate cyclase class 2
MPQEVEVKFRIGDLKALQERLRAAGFRLKTKRTSESNTLFDLPANKLRRRGELLRLREYGGVWTVTHKSKGKAGKHKSRIETETQVDDGPALLEIFRALGLKASFRYEKCREEWQDRTGHVVLDETPIGNYGEIEGTAKWIDATADRLGIRRSDYITGTYAELFFAWKKKHRSKAKEMTWTAVR